jgi:hypothetical protein
LARFWAQALGSKVLSERENEIVIGTDENAPVGMCFMPVTDPKTVKNRCILTSPAAPWTGIRRLTVFLRSGRAESTLGRPALSPGLSWPTLAETSSA